MKKFIRKFCSYTLVTIALAAIGMYVASYVYKKDRTPEKKFNLVKKSQDTISIVLGSSHAFHGTNTNMLGENCYNMASNSQTPYEDFIILKEIAKQKKITSVVSSLSYFSNYLYLEKIDLQGEKVRLFDYEHTYKASYTHDIAYYKSKIDLYSSMAGALVAEHKTTNLDKRGNVWEDCTGAEEPVANAVAVFKRHNTNSSFDTFNPYIDSIIAFCNDRNIKLNLVFYPMSSGYRAEIAKSEKRQEFEGFVNAVKSRASANVRVIDDRDAITGNEHVNFLDADHLSACGRNLFSKKLREQIFQ